MTATTRNAAGIPVKPVVWYAVGMTPAATVSGATPASTKNRTAGMPSRSLASMRDTALGRGWSDRVVDIGVVFSFWGVSAGVGLNAVGEQRAVDGRLSAGDQLTEG